MIAPRFIQKPWLFLVVASLVGSLAGPVPVFAEPPHQPATQASHPAVSTAPSRRIEPAVDAILSRLEKKGDQLQKLEAAIVYTKIDPILEDEQTYSGILRFKQDKPNPVFFIRFDQFKQEGVVRKSKQWHVFDGQWYIEARENTKTIVKKQIVRPGETLEVFKIGQGPFPLPFGQKKADILKHFDVKLVPPQTGDPKNADHLLCMPLPGTKLADKYDVIHFYIDRTLDLPVRVQTTEKQDGQEGNKIIASFDKVKVNPALSGDALKLPELRDYQIDTEPLPPPMEPVVKPGTEPIEK